MGPAALIAVLGAAHAEDVPEEDPTEVPAEPTPPEGTPPDESWPEDAWPEGDPTTEAIISNRRLRSGAALGASLALGFVGSGLVVAPVGITGQWKFAPLGLATGMAGAALGAHLYSEARYPFELAGAAIGVGAGGLVGAILFGIPAGLAYAQGKSDLGGIILGGGAGTVAVVGLGVGAWYAAVSDSKNRWRSRTSVAPARFSKETWGLVLAVQG